MVLILWMSCVVLERKSVSQLSLTISLGAEKPGQKVLMKKKGLSSSGGV
jgi:hypothetical protein